MAGVLAAHTTLPVIETIKSSTFDGLDALLSTVQMPKGIPVATVAVDGAENAAILAAQILAVSDESIGARLSAMRQQMEQDVLAKDQEIRRLTQMNKLEQLYEGKAKKVYKTDDENCYIISYKDDATAFNGEKRVRY